MKIAELKRALVEVHRICAERDYCYGCPFELDMPDRHICKLSPKLNNDMLPCAWDVDDWKEDEKDDNTRGTPKSRP